jgi:predicted aspartyl protease
MRSLMIVATTFAAALPVTAAAARPSHRERCTVVPWTEAAAPTVRVMIDGRGPFNFVVDTGAEGDGWISPELAARLNLKTIGTVPPDGPDDPEQDLRLFAARTLNVGGMTFAAPRFGEMLQMGPKRQPFDGMLGSGLFARLQIAFDYRHRLLLVTEGRLTTGQTVGFYRGLPVASLTIGDRSVEAHLDTGNIAGQLFVDRQAGEALPLAGEPGEKGRVRTHYGEQTIMEARLGASVMFGKTVLPVTTVRWPAAIGLNNLGSRGLANMLVRIDARTRRLAITPARAPIRCR